jgi:PAS domain S-box-containing protein
MGVRLIQRPEVRPIVEMMTGLPRILGCVKDAEGRYVFVNDGFADRLGRRSDELIGRTAHQVFPEDFARSYAEQDALVLRTGSPLQNHLELIVRADGTLGWYVTAKTRLAGSDGAILGIAVTSVDAQARLSESTSGLARAIQAVRDDVAHPWRVPQLAQIAEMSPKQFQRQTRKALGISPQQLIQRMRIEHAVHMMRTTRRSLGQISADCGFYDQSSFTRQFTRLLGLTPGAYRDSG